MKIAKQLLLLIILFPYFTYGQVNLCRDCAATIYDYTNQKKCCEECLLKFYLNKMQNNISHGKLSDYYKYEDWSTFISFPDTLSTNFSVINIESHNGYCLKDSKLIENQFYLIHLKCEDSIIQSGTSIVLIVNDSTMFDVGGDYHLKLIPYFKKNQDFRMIDGKFFSIVGGETMFDLVYKECLIVMLPVRKNYFFLSQ